MAVAENEICVSGVWSTNELQPFLWVSRCLESRIPVLELCGGSTEEACNCSRRDKEACSSIAKATGLMFSILPLLHWRAENPLSKINALFQLNRSLNGGRFPCAYNLMDQELWLQWDALKCRCCLLVLHCVQWEYISGSIFGIWMVTRIWMYILLKANQCGRTGLAHRSHQDCIWFKPWCLFQ